MANRRDIELLISARETTGRSFKQVTDNIDALNAKIGQQIQQAEKGEISLNDLRKSQEQLAQAGRDLANLQGQIDAYQKLAANQDKAAAAASKAAAALDEQRAKIAAAETVTDGMNRKLERLEQSVLSTSAALEKNKTDLAAQAEVLQRAGVATDQLETAQQGIVTAARNVGAGLSQVGASIDGYAANIQRAKDAQQALNAQAGFDRQVSEAQRLGDASRFVRLFADAIDTVKVGDNQLTALTGFRTVGQMAAESARDMSRFVETGQAMAITSREVAAGLRALIDPGGAALATLKGVEDTIRQADDAIAESPKNVAVLNTAYNNLSEAAASLIRQGALVDTFNKQEAAVGLARQQFEQAQAEVIRLGQAMQRAEVPTEQLVNELAQAEARLETTGRALSAEETKLGTLSRELKTAGIDTANLATETKRLEGAAENAGNAMARIATATGRGGAKTNGIFGLRPQDLTNVYYQLNDIFVSLSSGQKPLTVFIQQGAQLAQIPGLLSGVAGAIARFFPLIAIISGLVVVIGSMISQANQLKDFERTLSGLSNVDTSVTAQGLAYLSTELQRMGVSAEDAKSVLTTLAEEGFDAVRIGEYSEAAATLATRLGTDVKTATEDLISIQRGGIEAVYDLTEKTHDLTTADLDHAKALFDAGKAAEARQFVLDKVAARNKEIAEATQSQWTPAVNNLKTAFGNFIGYLQSAVAPVLDWLKGKVDSFVLGLTYATGLLAGLTSGKGFAAADAAAMDSARTVYNRQQGGGRAPKNNGATAQDINNRRALESAETQYAVEKKMTAQERLLKAATDARNKAAKEGADDATAARIGEMAKAKEQAQIDKEGEAAAKRSAAARNKAARAAETLANKQQAAQKELGNQLRQLDRAALTGASATLEERLQAIDEKYGNIAETIKKLRSLGLSASADGTSLADVEKQVEATKQRLKSEETIKFYQEQASLLTKQRAAEIDKITELQEQGAISTKDAMAQAAEINGRLSPQIIAAAQKALEIAKAIAGTNPSPEMVSWIASLERIVTGEGTANIVGKVGLDSLDEQSGRLNTLIKERDELVQSYQTLQDMGLKTSEQTRAAIAGAFQQQATAIQPVLEQLRQTVELLHNTKNELTGLPILTDTAYQTWLAKIQAVNAGLTQQTTTLSTLESSTLQNIANAGVNAFTTMQNSLAGLIAGTKSWGDVFSDVGGAILQSLADITASIAQAIIKFLILRALEAAAGLPPGTLSGGGGNMGGFFGLFHSGGTVGGTGGGRRVRRDHPANWIGAPKFHGGGGLGLQKDEYRAVLKRGEEVLTEENPRHIRNFGNDNDPGGGGGAVPPIKQTLLLDPSDIASAMQGRAGQKSILTTIRTNKETIKQMLK